MNKSKNYFFFIIFLMSINLIYGCSKIRESAGVERKSPNEFQSVENPPLIIPPNYDLVSPDQLKGKSIKNTDEELAQEILYGLDENNILKENQLSTLDLILSNADANDVPNNIRKEIDEDLGRELNVEDDGFLFKWEDEKEVLDAVKESERIRDNNFAEKSILDGEVPIKKEIIKRKKKKRFIFF